MNKINVNVEDLETLIIYLAGNMPKEWDNKYNILKICRKYAPYLSNQVRGILFWSFKPINNEFTDEQLNITRDIIKSISSTPIRGSIKRYKGDIND